MTGTCSRPADHVSADARGLDDGGDGDAVILGK